MVSLVSTVRDIERLRQILLVLARHGFGEVVERTGLARRIERREGESSGDLEAAPPLERTRLGARLRLVLEDLGPSFVKLGQILSTRPDLIPEDVIRELERLQDQVSPIPFEAVKAQIEDELGAPTEELFLDLDPKPLASASIAQVHRARIEDGEVVVKVQRPGIRTMVARDIELLHLIARAVERRIPEARIYAPVGMVQEFERAMSAELDFTREAEHAERFRHAFEGRSEVCFPRIHRELSGRDVLTMAYLPGRKLDAAIRDGRHQGPRIARVALRVIFEQIFQHGFFHADPHPGNLLILGEPEAPVLGMLDLGLVGRLSPTLRDKTVDLMLAAVRQDAQGVADALYLIGTPTRRIDRARYDAEVSYLAERYLGKRLEDIEMAALIRDLVQGATKYGLEIPPEFIMLGRTLMTIEGVGRELDPGLDVFGELRPLFVDLVKQRYTPERLSSALLRAAGRFGDTAQNLPSRLDELLADLREGRVELRTRDPGLASASDLLGRRVLSGLTVAGLVLGGSQLVAAGAVVPGYALVTGGAIWLLGHTLWAGRRARRS